MLIARGFITIWACKDGESISVHGKWRSGVVTPYLGIVRMGTCSFVCKVRSGSVNPPIWIYTDAQGNRYTTADGYVLSGDYNTAEYELIAEDGIPGMQGVPGEPGKDGHELYTWIRYADDANGKGISNDPAGKTYIGFAYNKEHPLESNNPADYVWSKFKGDKGDTGLQGLQGPQGLQGIPGKPGAAGKTTYFHVKYSPVQNPTASQMTETPSVYIGTYVDFTEADSTDPQKYTWARHQGLQGPQGNQGIPGKNGANGQTSYLHIAYATSADGSQGFDTANPAGKSYIGVCVDFNQQDPNSYKSYTWSLIKGTDGVPGKPGADGKTLYTWIAYSDNANGSPMYQVPHAKTKYIGIATNKLTATESNTPADYTWSKFQGDKGDTGADGKPGATGPQGPQGDGFTHMGRWKSGMLVPKMGVVTMGGSSYVAKVATRNAPLCIYKDATGNFYTYSDGGYVLTGEVNSAEYDVLSEKGEDGKPGADGKQGIQGCIIRDSEWSSAGVQYRNDEVLTSGTRYIDIALVATDSNDVGWNCYKCKVTHNSNSSNKPGTSGGGTYWELMSNVGPIFTSLLIAKNAKIKFLQGNQLLIQKSNGSVTAGLSGSDAGNKTRFWAGSNVPDSAPFRVNEAGSMYASNATISGTINANSGNIAGFTINPGYIGLDQTSSAKGMSLYSTGVYFRSPNKKVFLGTEMSAFQDQLLHLEDTTNNYLPHVAIKFNLKGANPVNNCFAFMGQGHGVLNGFIEGYRLNYITFPSSNNHFIMNLMLGKYVEVNGNYSDCHVYLPRLSNVREALGITSGDFAVRLTIVLRAGYTTILWGRRKYSVGGINFDTGEFPWLRDNGFGNAESLELKTGDCVEVLLTYSINEYNAYTINIHR